MLRRTFLAVASVSGLGAASLGLAKCSLAAPAASLPSTLDPQTARLAAELIQQLQKWGYRQAPALPLVTGHPFNGGLQYDEDIDAVVAGHYVIQPAARVEDLAEKGRVGVLPLFHIISFEQRGGGKGTAPLDQSLDFLVRRLGLEPDRMRFTGTEKARPLFPLLTRHGVAELQIRLVDWDRARALGTGSGYFQPKGHPRSPSFNTLSIEYLLADGGELEIAELMLTDDPAAAVQGVGFGLERLSFARGDRLISWQETLPGFRRAVEFDARQQGLALPPGYYEMLGLPKPS